MSICMDCLVKEDPKELAYPAGRGSCERCGEDKPLFKLVPSWTLRTPIYIEP